MKHLELQNTKTLNNGKGFVSRTTKDSLIVLSADKELRDTREDTIKRKIGVSLCSGCDIRCIYCFTNNLKHFRPLSVNEIIEQVDMVLEHTVSGNSFDEVKVSFKQMGDPLLNPGNVLEAINRLHQRFPKFDFVVSTSAPRINQYFFDNLQGLIDSGIKIRLQFSCHTTSDKERRFLSPCLSMMDLEEISLIANNWNGEAITLNFVMLNGFEYSVKKLRRLFVPKRVFVKVNYLDDNSQLGKHELSDMDKQRVNRFTQGLTEEGFKFAFRN